MFAVDVIARVRQTKVCVYTSTMNEQAHILICGRDAALLETRSLVLQSAGFRVSTITRPLAMSRDLGNLDLLLVCHTLSAQERQADLCALATLAPKAKALCLRPSPGLDESCGATLDSFAGPRKMLTTVTEVLNG